MHTGSKRRLCNTIRVQEETFSCMTHKKYTKILEHLLRSCNFANQLPPSKPAAAILTSCYPASRLHSYPNQLPPNKRTVATQTNSHPASQLQLPKPAGTQSRSISKQTSTFLQGGAEGCLQAVQPHAGGRAGQPGPQHPLAGVHQQVPGYPTSITLPSGCREHLISLLHFPSPSPPHRLHHLPLPLSSLFPLTQMLLSCTADFPRTTLFSSASHFPSTPPAWYETFLSPVVHLLLLSF